MIHHERFDLGHFEKNSAFCCEIQYFSSLIYCSKVVGKVQFWSRPHATPKLVFTYMFYLYIIFYICKIQRGVECGLDQTSIFIA